MNRFRHQKLSPSWQASAARWPHKLYRCAIPILQKQRLLGETAARHVAGASQFLPRRDKHSASGQSLLCRFFKVVPTYTRTIQKWLLENACKHKKGSLREKNSKKNRYTSRKNINHQNSAALQNLFVPRSVFGQPTAAHQERCKHEHTLYRLFGTEMYNSNCQCSAFIERQAAIFFFLHRHPSLCNAAGTTPRPPKGQQGEEGGLQG